MSNIKIENLTFAYPGTYQNIFENVTLNLDSQWKLGFTGRNGRGKTTFLKLLMGKYAYEGRIHTKVNFDAFPFEISEPSRLTYEVIESLAPEYEHWQLMKEMNLMGVDEECLYRPFDSLSLGEQTKMEMIILFLKENRFLLIDEPTNHLDEKGRQVMMQYLEGKSGFIVVSHDRAFLDGCTDHTLCIQKTNIEIVQGSYSSFLRDKKRKDNYELAQNDKLKKEVTALAYAAKRAAGWSDALEATKTGNGHVDRGYIGAKSAKMMKRAKSLQRRKERAAEEKSKLLKDIEMADALEMVPLDFRTQTLMRLTEVNIQYGQKEVIRNFSCEIRKGERIAIRGGNGAGKSTLLKAIMNELHYEGQIYKPADLEISYVSQDTQSLKGSIQAYIENSGVEAWLFRSMLQKLDFSLELYEKALEQLSEGQKKKVLLAKSLCERAHIYVWDEPLNYIDVISREQIEAVLLESKPTLIFVEHDRTFNEKIATQVIAL